jgi:hypothetical protein
MVKRKSAVAAVVGGVVGALGMLSFQAFAATTSVNLAAGDSANVGCAGPSLSWSQTGTHGVASCAPNPTGTAKLELDLTPGAFPDDVLAHSDNIPFHPVVATTGSFRPPAHAVIVVGVATNNYAAAPAYNTSLASVTNSGTPLTWTRQAASDWPSSGVEGGSETWTATTGATAPGQITITARSMGILFSSADWVELETQVVTDSDGSTPIVGNHAAGQHNGGLPSVPMTMSPGSLGFAADTDWHLNTGPSAYGPGLENVYSDFVAPDYAWHFFRTTAASPGGSTTFNMTAPSGQEWNETVVEVKLATP